MKCKANTDDGIIKYHVHYLGYKKSRDRWLTAQDMVKDTSKSRKFFENSCLRKVVVKLEKDDTDLQTNNSGAKDAVHDNEISEASRKKRSRASPKKPEVALSSQSKAVGTEDSYDEDDYRSLHERYLMPRVREKVELPNGCTLRRQIRARVIDQNTQGYRMLRCKVDSLLRKNNHSEVYRLLCQLRNWELDPQRVPAVFLEGNDAVEVIDLSKEDDGTGNSCINVDEFIADVLLVPSHTPEMTASSREVRRVSPPDQSRKESESVARPKSAQRKKQVAGLHVTNEAIEEVKSFAYSVVQSVNQESDPPRLRGSTSTHAASVGNHSVITAGFNTFNSIPVSPQRFGPGGYIVNSIPPYSHVPREEPQLELKSPAKVSYQKSPKTDMKKPTPVAPITPDIKQKSPRKKKKPKRNASKKLTIAPQRKPCQFTIKDFAFPAPPTNGSKRRKRDCHSRRRRMYTFTTAATPQKALIPPIRMLKSTATNMVPIADNATILHEGWKIQSNQRKKGQWIPSGHLNGRWKPPQWATNGIVSSKHKKKYPGCRKALLPKLDSLVSDFTAELIIKHDDNTESRPSSSIQDVICVHYTIPTGGLLRSAHFAVQRLLPKGDCEDWDVVELARRYYNFWRPKHTKVILLAESHAFTTKERAFTGPGLDVGILQDIYNGPHGFLNLVYCLAYGENEALSGQAVDKSNKGTPQFWTLLAACSRGVEHVATTASKKEFSSPFAADLLKGGGLPVKQRLKAKLEVLEDLKRRGIWLLDASIFGWYISQPQSYARSSISNEVHRKQKSRPPPELKVPSLVLSWELFTKHLVRDVAKDGHLKLLVPIG